MLGIYMWLMEIAKHACFSGTSHSFAKLLHPTDFQLNPGQLLTWRCMETQIGYSANSIVNTGILISGVSAVSKTAVYSNSDVVLSAE